MVYREYMLRYLAYEKGYLHFIQRVNNVKISSQLPAIVSHLNAINLGIINVLKTVY
jgi:hypothetical protein